MQSSVRLWRLRKAIAAVCSGSTAGPPRVITGLPRPGHDLLTGTDRPVWPLVRPPFVLETSVPGVFAAGDVRHGSVKRVAAAVGEGSVAIQFLHQLFDADDLHPRGRPRDAATTV